MNSVSMRVPLNTTEGQVQGEITGWGDGSILVTVGGVPVRMDPNEARSILDWAALDWVECRIVTEIPAQEVADRAEAALVLAALVVEQEAAPPVDDAPALACAKCGATDVKLVDVPTGAVCIPCIVAGLAKP